MAALLQLENTSVGFPKQGMLRFAVRNLDYTLSPGTISCLVGESGCGKSMAAKAIMRLLPENAILGGNIFFENQNLAILPEKSMRKIRGSAIGMIFQEPMTSLNPVLTVGSQTAEPLRIHLGLDKKSAKEKVLELFRDVGIPSPKARYSDYPHQLSGGMRQRVMIAMALACGPKLLLADEPTTALDATVQGQILRLLSQQNKERGMAVLLITHDLGVVTDVADFVGVMYAGSLMESAPVQELFENPLHPYTRGLMACAPSRNSAGQKRLPSIPGHVPALDQLPPGCPFEPRCDKALPVCRSQFPPTIKNFEHSVSCWLYSA